MSFTVGMRGSIDMEGLDVGGVPCRMGTRSPGVITEITDAGLTVRLDAPFSGVAVLEEISPERFAPRTQG